jgi:hypothetical protein
VQNNSAFTDIRVDKSADQLAHMQLARGTGEIIAVHQRLEIWSAAASTALAAHGAREE